MADLSILLYGRTGAGKTAQIGELAEHVLDKTGKLTRLYTADRGGTRTIKPFIDSGLIECVEIGNINPWLFMDKATRGMLPDKKGKFSAVDNSHIGLFAFESFRSYGEILRNDMAVMAGKGVNIGGGSNIAFVVTDQTSGDSLKVSGSNMSHYGVAQDFITEKIWQSLRLQSEYLIWTSSVSKDEDPNASGKILGPDVIGKALNTETPRWFDLIFRQDVQPAGNGKPERHILFLGTHQDVNAGNAAALGNIRLPLDADMPKEIAIEPASIVKALELVDAGYQAAFSKVQARIADKLKSRKKA